MPMEQTPPIDVMLDALWAIDPTHLDYGEWDKVMAIAAEYDFDPIEVDRWNAQDRARYNPGEAEIKMASHGHYGEGGVTWRTLFKMAYESGWEGPDGRGSDDTTYFFGTTMSADEFDEGEDDEDVTTPHEGMSPEEQTRAMIEALFEPDEIVNVVLRLAEIDGKLGPDKGFHCPAKEVMDVLGRIDPDPSVGAWVCANPLDGKGTRGNENVTSYRHIVVESDECAPGRFIQVTRQLGGPVSTLTTSGNKSVHALWRVDAEDLTEYRDYFEVIKKAYADNGVTIDKSCGNPARLTRLAGFRRGE